MSDTIITAIITGSVSITVALLGFIFSNLKAKQETKKMIAGENTAIKLAIQALLRCNMIASYNEYTSKGYAPIYARENFENMWIQYEALGANGVMSDIHDKFMDLPTQKQEVVA